jgi:hypothetical protein
MKRYGDDPPSTYIFKAASWDVCVPALMANAADKYARNNDDLFNNYECVT